MESVNNENSIFEQSWLTKKAVLVKFACIVIHDNFWSLFKSTREYVKWLLRGLTVLHYRESITHTMGTINGEDTRS